ncbi:hypothetical protein ElyMa_001148800 [Elysia marginata]|uniref:BZIP domain-containing protein n=1 Tax=Elysia marginata TaxID=1093978 RepID=A0AAV4HZF4_9GAST|nr:hypothetical protein ElyMa_001148800 [Elysia marginata]
MIISVNHRRETTQQTQLADPDRKTNHHRDRIVSENNRKRRHRAARVELVQPSTTLICLTLTFTSTITMWDGCNIQTFRIR